MKRDPVVLIIVAMVVTAMLVFGYHMSRRDADPSAAGVGAMKGKAAPDFELKSLEGKTVHLSDYHGKAVLLNFWATYCGPCKVEMPWLVELQKQYGPDGLQIVGVAMDDASQDDIAKFAKGYGSELSNPGRQGIGWRFVRRNSIPSGDFLYWPRWQVHRPRIWIEGTFGN